MTNRILASFLMNMLIFNCSPFSEIPQFLKTTFEKKKERKKIKVWIVTLQVLSDCKCSLGYNLILLRGNLFVKAIMNALFSCKKINLFFLLIYIYMCGFFSCPFQHLYYFWICENIFLYLYNSICHVIYTWIMVWNFLSEEVCVTMIDSCDKGSMQRMTKGSGSRQSDTDQSTRSWKISVFAHTCINIADCYN